MSLRSPKRLKTRLRNVLLSGAEDVAEAQGLVNAAPVAEAGAEVERNLANRPKTKTLMKAQRNLLKKIPTGTKNPGGEGAIVKRNARLQSGTLKLNS